MANMHEMFNYTVNQMLIRHYSEVRLFSESPEEITISPFKTTKFSYNPVDIVSIPSIIEVCSTQIQLEVNIHSTEKIH